MDENCPFIDDVPIETSIYYGLSMAMLNNQRVHHLMGYEWELKKGVTHFVVACE